MKLRNFLGNRQERMNFCRNTYLKELIDEINLIKIAGHNGTVQQIYVGENGTLKILFQKAMIDLKLSLELFDYLKMQQSI